MIMKIFSVYDSKGESFHRPYFLPRTAEAIRSFSELANDPQSPLGKFPGDYTLFELGEFDTDKGTITTLEFKQNLGTALEHQKPMAPAALQQPVKLAEANNA